MLDNISEVHSAARFLKVPSGGNGILEWFLERFVIQFESQFEDLVVFQ